MSNVAPIHPTRRVLMTVHQVTFDLVPRAIVEELFYAALAVGWSADDENYTAACQDSKELLENLQKVVSAASQYTIPVEREFDEPVQSA